MNIFFIYSSPPHQVLQFLTSKIGHLYQLTLLKYIYPLSLQNGQGTLLYNSNWNIILCIIMIGVVFTNRRTMQFTGFYKTLMFDYKWIMLQQLNLSKYGWHGKWIVVEHTCFCRIYQICIGNNIYRRYNTSSGVRHELWCNDNYHNTPKKNHVNYLWIYFFISN